VLAPGGWYPKGAWDRVHIAARLRRPNNVASTLLAMAYLANDAGFRNRVQAAMVTAGLNVAAEAVGVQDTNTYQLRHQLAMAVLNNTGAYLDRFAWAAAANVTVAGDVGPPVSIASSTAANPAAVTCASVHGLTTGDFAEISGHLVNLVVNGTWPVTVTSTTVFSIPVAGQAAGSATGQVAKQPPDADIQFAVNAAWSDIAGVGVTT
jgi:hypothetical protein